MGATFAAVKFGPTVASWDRISGRASPCKDCRARVPGRLHHLITATRNPSTAKFQRNWNTRVPALVEHSMTIPAWCAWRAQGARRATGACHACGSTNRSEARHECSTNAETPSSWRRKSVPLTLKLAPSTVRWRIMAALQCGEVIRAAAFGGRTTFPAS